MKSLDEHSSIFIVISVNSGRMLLIAIFLDTKRNKSDTYWNLPQLLLDFKKPSAEYILSVFFHDESCFILITVLQ